MLTQEMKLKLFNAVLDFMVYWAPAIFLAVMSAIAWVIPKAAEKLREKSPWASVDQAITLIERFVLALVHSSMDEATKIKSDASLTPAQKAEKLEALAKRIEAESRVYAEKVLGDQLVKVLGENPISYIRGIIERFVREIKARFSSGK